MDTVQNELERLREITVCEGYIARLPILLRLREFLHFWLARLFGRGAAGRRDGQSASSA
jgi:hypothetical protein